jgi:hypothetical protein
MKDLFLIMKPRRAESRVALNLVKDAGGKVVEKNCIGIVVQCKKSIAKALDLMPIINV